MTHDLLIVEDEENTLQYLHDLCRRELPDVGVMATRSGEQALKIVETMKPSVVLLDIQLPDIDGFEVCQRLKADPKTAASHVLMMSGVHVETEDRIRGIKTGADGYLIKPFEPLELIVQLQALLRWTEVVETTRMTFGKLVADFSEAQRENEAKLRDEISERRKAEEAIQAIFNSTAAVGQQFFRSLVLELSRVLQVRYALVGEIAPRNPGTISTIAFCAEGKIAENFDCPVKNTPHEIVIGRSLTSYPRDAHRLFPQDSLLVEKSIESYMGVPLFTASGMPLGVVAIMHDSPLPETALSKNLLSILAARAGMELERLQLEKSVVSNIAANQVVLDLLSARMAVVNGQGSIISTNKEWRRFAAENAKDEISKCSLGANFFHVCHTAAAAGDAFAKKIIDGIQDILNGKVPRCEVTYDADTPSGVSRFVMHIAALGDGSGSMAIVAETLADRVRR